MFDDLGWLVAILIGIAAGWIAEQATGRRHGILTNLAVGLLGSFIGWWLASVIDIGVQGWIEWLLTSTIGAVILLAIFGMVRRR